MLLVEPSANVLAESMINNSYNAVRPTQISVTSVMQLTVAGKSRARPKTISHKFYIKQLKTPELTGVFDIQNENLTFHLSKSFFSCV